MSSSDDENLKQRRQNCSRQPYLLLRMNAEPTCVGAAHAVLASETRHPTPSTCQGSSSCLAATSVLSPFSREQEASEVGKKIFELWGDDDNFIWYMSRRSAALVGGIAPANSNQAQN